MIGARPIIAAVALIAAPAVGKTCTVNEATLLGAWAVESGGFFEEMAFEREDGARVFNSWLHQRPDVSNGRWSLSGCQLRIDEARASRLVFNYMITSLSRRTLVMRDGEDGSVIRYRRID